MVSLIGRIRRRIASDGRTSEYLRYALGEVALIVVGILLALQINDWNADRIEQRQVRDNSLALLTDLAADRAMLGPVDAQIRVILKQSNELAAYVRDKPLGQLSNAEIFLLTYGTSYRPYEWHRASIDRLKETGALRAMRDQVLARAILRYDALTRHLDQDYQGDTAAIMDARPVVNRIRDMNYPEIGRILGYFASVPDEGYEQAFFAFRETPIFHGMEARHLPLLSTDPTDLGAMVNSALEIRDAIRPRVEVEFPRLRVLSEQISERIRTEYH
ncbi:MAG: hypothetical protein U1F09_14840 [Steroidobacteraceae bacterium]